MNKLTFEALSIEITRRCNMVCTHCVRGTTQAIDINRSHIDALLNQTELIGSLFFAGGEPLLNLDAMEYTANELCKHGIPLLNLEIISNGFLYDERLIEVLRFYREIIDTSCAAAFGEEYNYNPQNEISRIMFGISLDKYHTNHKQCEENYQRYKQALSGIADVYRVKRGNQPIKCGRAVLLENAIPCEKIKQLEKTRRIECFSKNNIPACPVANTFQLCHENQRIVCCGIYMNVHGNLSTVAGGAFDWIFSDRFPKICSASDNIWEKIQQYNIEKIPCIAWKKRETEIKFNTGVVQILNDAKLNGANHANELARKMMQEFVDSLDELPINANQKNQFQKTHKKG